MRETKICPYCTPWCATTEKQLAHRLKNLSEGGRAYGCPACGGEDWAITRAKIEQASVSDRLLYGVWPLPVVLLVLATLVVAWMVWSSY